MRRPLRYREFHDWLMRQKGRVGIRGSCARCPIARYLEREKGLAPWVNPSSLKVNNEEAVMPKWASQFARAVDKSGRPYSNITAPAARRILRKCRP